MRINGVYNSYLQVKADSVSIMTKAWIFTSFFISFSVLGQSVMLPEEPLVVTKSGQGCYGPLWQELKQRIPTLKGFFVPLRRIHDLFSRTEFDCVFPFSGETGLAIYDIDSTKVIVSKPVNQIGVYLLTRERNVRLLADIRDDPGIQPAAQLGLEKLLKDWKGEIYWASELKQVFGMMALNRVDYIIATFPDGYRNFQKSNLKVVTPLVLSTDNFACKDTDVVVNAVNRIDELIEEMKSDGTLQQKLGDCFFNVEMVPQP